MGGAVTIPDRVSFQASDHAPPRTGQAPAACVVAALSAAAAAAARRKVYAVERLIRTGKYEKKTPSSLHNDLVHVWRDSPRANGQCATNLCVC